jgi:NADH-quinone oxidoreductase subunit C
VTTGPEGDKSGKSGIARPDADPTPADPTQAAGTREREDNLPRATGGTVEQAAALSKPEPRGMFGVRGTGDTSGFGGLTVPVAPEVSSPKPYGGWFDEATDTLDRAVSAEIVSRVVVDRGELTLYVEPSGLIALATALRNDPALRFELLSSVSGVDYIGTAKRLHVVYQFTSMTYRRRLRVETAVTVEDPHVPSLVGLYPTADWHERECWDMFGVVFDGHPGLTRIEMPDDWEGHPQRKDYPLGGIPVEYKGASIPPPDERRSYA